VEYADTQRRAIKAEYIPDLSLAVTYLSYFGIDLLPRNVAQAGLQLKWQPLDWGRPKRLASAGVHAEQAKNDAAALESRIALEVGRAFRALGEAQAQLEVRRLAREAAVEKARVALHKQEEQASLAKDALEARAAAAEAESQYQDALAQLWTARTELDKAIGEEI
jgi:outer membrane protein